MHIADTRINGYWTRYTVSFANRFSSSTARISHLSFSLLLKTHGRKGNAHFLMHMTNNLSYIRALIKQILTSIKLAIASKLSPFILEVIFSLQTNRSAGNRVIFDQGITL